MFAIMDHLETDDYPLLNLIFLNFLELVEMDCIHVFHQELKAGSFSH